MMAATKPTAPLRDRRLSPSTSPLHQSSASHLTRPSPLAPLSRGTTTSPPALSKKAVPNYLKPKASPLSEPPQRPSVTSSTTATTSKALSATRPMDKTPVSSTGALQRSSKPASPTQRPSSSSRLNCDKVASRVTRSQRNSPAPKSKSTSPVPTKKKEAPATIAAASSPGKLFSDYKFDMGMERTEREHLKSKPEKVAEASNELKNVEVALYVSPKVEGENHIEEWKGGEPEHLENEPETQMHNEIPKEAVVLKEILKQGGTAVAATAAEKRDEGKIGNAKVEVPSRPVEPEARKPRLGAAVATVVAATPMKKKNTPVSNDVIEETKSKLMGTRKNRVLALVGAFETVISLHEPEVQQNQKAYPLQQDQQTQPGQKIENEPSQVQHDQQIQQGQNEDTLENQQEQQIQHDQQIGESLENQQDQQVYEAKNDQQQEGGDEDQQSQGNDQHQEKEEGVDALLKEEEKGEVSMLKEVEVVENAMLIEENLMEEETDDAPLLESSKTEPQILSVEST